MPALERVIIGCILRTGGETVGKGTVGEVTEEGAEEGFTGEEALEDAVEKTQEMHWRWHLRIQEMAVEDVLEMEKRVQK